MRKIDYNVYVEGGYYDEGGFGVAAYVITDGVTGEDFYVGNIVVHESTSMRIFIEGAIDAMKHVPHGCSINFITDQTYLVNIVNHKWRIKANGDLWGRFELIARNGMHMCCGEWRSIRNNDTILQRCWRTCSDIAGFDFLEAFLSRHEEKRPAPHGSERS
jgi:ribonuclease HI